MDITQQLPKFIEFNIVLYIIKDLLPDDTLGNFYCQLKSIVAAIFYCTFAMFILKIWSWVSFRKFLNTFSFMIHIVWIKMFIAVQWNVSLLSWHLKNFGKLTVLISLKNVPIKGLYQGEPKYGVPVFNPREENGGRYGYLKRERQICWNYCVCGVF